MFGDNLGLPILERRIPKGHVCGVVAAGIRPQFHSELGKLAREGGHPFFIQPKHDGPIYEEFVQWVKAQKPDLIWANSYSMLIRSDVLEIPRYGGVNIHAALLPQYRGCNPIQWAIINNEYQTGVTLHEMAAGFDEGSIISQKFVPLFFEDTWVQVQKRLVLANEELVQDIVPLILTGQWPKTPQVNELARLHRRRTPEDGKFSWNQPIIEIYNLVRALVEPNPGAFYLNSDLQKSVIPGYLSPGAITRMKYTIGGERLQGENVRLCPLSSKDGSVVRNWLYNRGYLGYWPKPSEEGDVGVDDVLKRTDLIFFLVEELSSGKFLGTCQLLNINWLHRNAELQIHLEDSSVRRSDILSDIVKKTTWFCFSELNLNRVNVFVSKESDAAVLETCGFGREGMLRQAIWGNDGFEDVFCQSFIRSEYE